MVVFPVVPVCGLLDLLPILTIALVDIALLIFVAAIPGIMFAVATAGVARVILIVVRALIVVPVLVVVRKLLVIVAVILSVILIDASTSLTRGTVRGRHVRAAVGGRHVVLLPLQVMTGLVATVVRTLPLTIVFLVLLV